MQIRLREYANKAKGTKDEKPSLAATEWLASKKVTKAPGLDAKHSAEAK